MRTKYIIDDFQQTYFVIDSFDALLDSCAQDLENLYRNVKTESDLDAHIVLENDQVLHHGTLEYFKR